VMTPTIVAAASPSSSTEAMISAVMPETTAAVTTTTAAAPLTPDSPGYKGSAQEGLDLFHQVVVSHVQPKAAAIYAAQLGGLSFTVHEYSAMSRPVEPWVVESKKLLKRRAKVFLKNGELSEVTMEKPKPHASMTSSTLLAAVDNVKAACGAAVAEAGSKSAVSAALPSIKPSLSTAATPTSSLSSVTSSPMISVAVLSRPGSSSSSSGGGGGSGRTSLSVSATASIGGGHVVQKQRAASYPPSPNSHKQTGGC
jgi:hypothetical protein